MERLRKRKVWELRQEPVVVDPSAPLSKVASTLEERGVYEAFVELRDRVGVVSIRGILEAKNLDAKAESSILYVPRLSPEEPLYRAAHFMSHHRVRSLPIVEGRELVAAVTAKAIVERIAEANLPPIKPNDLMTPNPITISPHDVAARARSLMVTNSIDHLPVLSGKDVVGVVTSDRLVSIMLPRERIKRGAYGIEAKPLFEFPVKELMDDQPLRCDVESYASEIVKEMVSKSKTYALITLWGELQGIVTYRDVVSLLAEEVEAEIPAYIVGLPDNSIEAGMAKAKFLKMVNALSKSLPSIMEARSRIKASSASGDRRFYEVTVLIKARDRVYTHSETGWDLANIFDAIGNRLKRMASEKPKTKRGAREKRAFLPEAG